MKIDFNNYKTFGNLLQRLREEKAVSARSAAIDVGVSAVYLIDIEKGNRQPPKGEILNKICAYYNISEEEKEKIKELIEVERLGTTKEQLEFLSHNRHAREVVNMLMQIENFDDFINKNPQAILEIEQTILNITKNEKTNTL